MEKTNQIIYFTSGFKKTVMNIVGIKEGEFCHLKCSDGRTILINKDKVNMVEIIPDSMAKASWGELANTYAANYQKWGKDED